MSDRRAEIFSKLAATICGHTVQIERIGRMLAGDRAPHALLFSGPSRTGKGFLARNLAASLLAEIPPAEQSSETVQRLVLRGNHPDLHLLFAEEGKKDIAVDQVRELTNSLVLKPYSASCTVVIIDDAHRMNQSAANALLKTLEEPTGSSFLFLVTDAAHRLPPTILSRCQTIHFGQLTDKDIAKVLTNLLEDGLSSAELKSLTAYCDGSLEPLQLAPFLDSRSLAVTDAKGLRTHLSQLSTTVKDFEREIGRLINQATNVPVALAATLAADLTSQKQIDAIFWQTLHAALRAKLRTQSSPALESWANLVMESLAAQQLIAERNLSPQLQLTSLFLKAADAAAL